jgi:hypothetical protein
MARIPHGGRITLEKIEEAEKNGPLNMLALGIPGGAGGLADFNKFGYLFPDLQTDDNNLLPIGPDTVANLKRLGQTMTDSSPSDEANSTVPAAYTYLGQFIDHDITFEVASGDLADLSLPGLEPLSSAEIESRIRNTRSAKFDLDSVYEGLAERDGDGMALGFVSPTPNNTVFPLKRPPGKGDHNDLPRKGRITSPAIDREALIGDPRNDENTIISQLHLSFLLAHNAIVARGHKFDAARTLLRQHYQWMVIHDFLKKICDSEIVDQTFAKNSFYDPSDYDFFMPLEFSVAAYRFGHSMIRADYDFNLNFNSSGTPGTTEASLARLFTFTAFVGQLGNFNSLPENWIIEWERFFGPAAGFNMARKFDTKLVEPLAHLTDTFGHDLSGIFKLLAVRNLLRGYLLRMPTGQSVATALGVVPLTSGQITAAAASAEQASALTETGFDERTPLWYYILAEAAHVGGNHLGPVGSLLVAETIIGLIRRSDDSIFDGNFSPSLGSTPGNFDMPDLLRLAGVLT